MTKSDLNAPQSQTLSASDRDTDPDLKQEEMNKSDLNGSECATVPEYLALCIKPDAKLKAAQDTDVITSDNTSKHGLVIKPTSQLQFSFVECKNGILACTKHRMAKLAISNHSEDIYAYKVKATAPGQFEITSCVTPCSVGMVIPGGNRHILILNKLLSVSLLRCNKM